MAITKNTLPAINPEFILPQDSSLIFATAQTLTATGYINNVNPIIDVGPGRIVSMLAVDATALDLTSGDEFYQFYTLGSNDVAFGNGNVENLMDFDIAAASAGRMVPTIMGASPGIPPTTRAGTLIAKPFTNYTYDRYVFRYLKFYLVTGGTTPSITLSAWIVPTELKL
jgi:hypothetical protein